MLAGSCISGADRVERVLLLRKQTRTCQHRAHQLRGSSAAVGNVGEHVPSEREELRAERGCAVKMWGRTWVVCVRANVGGVRRGGCGWHAWGKAWVA